MSALRELKLRIFVFLIIVTLVYAYLARPVEKVTDFVKLGEHIYLTAGPVGLRILDVHQGGVELAGSFLTEDYAAALEIKELLEKGLIRRIAYVADSSEGIAVIDVTNPAHPVSVQQAGGDTVLDLSLWNNYLYAATGNDGVIVFKIDPQGKLEKVKKAGLAGQIEKLAVGQDRLFLMDEETLQVHALGTDPVAPPKIGTFAVKDTVNDIQVISGLTHQQVYLAADRSGVVGLSVSQPITPTASVAISVTLAFDTPGRAMSVFRYDQVALVADGKKGVRAYDVSQAEPPEIAFFETWGLTTRILPDPQSSHLYVGDGYSGLRQLDFLPNMKQTQEAAIPEARAGGMAYAAPYLFVANGGQGVRVLSRGASGDWEEAAFYDTPGRAQAVQVRTKETLAFVADGSQLSVLGMNELYGDRTQAQRENPQVHLQGKLEFGPDTDAQDIRLAPNRPIAYLAAGKAGLLVVDTRDPHDMAVLGRELAGDARRLDLARNYAFVASGEQGIHIINIHDDHFPTRVETVSVNSPAMGVAVWDTDPTRPVFVYVAAGDGGLCTFPALSSTALSQPVCLAAGKAQDVVVNPESRQVYVVTADGLIIPFSLEDPAHPRPLEPANLGQPLNRVIFHGPEVIAAAGLSGLRWIDLNDRSRPAGEFDFAQPIKQFVKHGSYIYATNGPRPGRGNNLGLRILDASQPGQAQEVGRYRSVPYPGSVPHKGEVAYAVTVHPDGNPAYLADGINGLRVLDVSNPKQPRLVQTILYGLDARHFWVDRQNPKRGYLALGSGDLALVDLTHKFAPGVMNSTQACNPSPAVWVQSYRGEYAFLACEGTGVASVWVLDAARIALADRYEAAYTVHNFTIMDPQDAEQMAPVLLDPSFTVPYLLAAADQTGLVVLNIAKPWRLEAAPNYDPRQAGTILSVASRDTYAFVARGQGAVKAYSMFVPGRPLGVSDFIPLDAALPISTTALYAESLSPSNPANTPSGYRIYAANSVNGLVWNKIVKEPKLEQAGLYETPGTASFWEVANVIAHRSNQALEDVADVLKELHLDPLAKKVDDSRHGLAGLVKRLAEQLGTPWPATGVSPKAAATLKKVFLGDFLLLGLGAILVWLALFGQFALPVKGARQRLLAASRLAAYLMGSHGTMTRLQNGQILRPEDDGLHHGPGVVLVDVTSAAVLEKRILNRSLPLQLFSKLLLRSAPTVKAPYGLQGGEPLPPVRVVGPGLVFTHGNSALSNPKWDEVVLRPVDLRTQVRTTAEEVYALTQEGIEVKNRVFCLFTLGAPPDVLLVTYDGGVQEEKYLRVVTLAKYVDPANQRKNIWQRRVVVRSLADELDPDDKAEIHQQVQAWRREGLHMQPYSEQAIKAYTTIRGAPFIIDEQRIFAAAAARADYGGLEKQLEWYELPERTAVKIYRDMLHQRPYDALYRPGDPDSYPLKAMKGDFVKKVRNQGVLAYQYIESENVHTPLNSEPEPTMLEKQQEQENKPGPAQKQEQVFSEDGLRVYPIRQLTNAKVLRARGIKVIAAGFTELKPVSSGVQQRLTENWRSRWEKHADRMRTDYQLQALRIRSHARAEAQLDMVKSLSDIFCREQSKEALALRVFQALEAAAADPLTRQMLPGETIAMLQVLRNWLVVEGDARPAPVAGPPNPGQGGY